MAGFRRFIPITVLAAIIAYLGHHALHGEQGFMSYAAVQSRISGAEAELNRVRAERQHLEDRVSRLSPTNGELDLDFLEERSREVLNFAHPDEIIVKIETDDRGW